MEEMGSRCRARFVLIGRRGYRIRVELPGGQIAEAMPVYRAGGIFLHSFPATEWR